MSVASTAKPIYTLDSGNRGAEMQRLNEQHGILRMVTNNLLPDKIKSHLLGLGRPAAVADIATGTGIWLADLAPELPSDSQLDGYDLDVSRFPDASTMPLNIKIRYADALKPFPKEAQGQYDCVHVRLMAYALKADQWELVVANLGPLLRPGGWLVWEELSYTSWTCLPMTKEFQTWMDIEVRYAASVGRDILAPMHLPAQVDRQGFSNVSEQTFSSWRLSAEERKNIGKGYRETASQSMHGIVSKGGFDWLTSQEQVDKLINQFTSDVENDRIVTGIQMHWILGQNPS